MLFLLGHVTQKTANTTWVASDFLGDYHGIELRCCDSPTESINGLAFGLMSQNSLHLQIVNAFLLTINNSMSPPTPLQQKQQKNGAFMYFQ